MQRWTGEKRPAELLLLRPNPFPPHPHPSFSLPNSRATLLDPLSRQQHTETNEIIGWKSKEGKEVEQGGISMSRCKVETAIREVVMYILDSFTYFSITWKASNTN